MKYADLLKMTDEELIDKYDETAEHTSVGLSYYTEELARRRTEKSDNLMLKLTKQITIMTAIMLLATIVNIVVVIIG